MKKSVLMGLTALSLSLIAAPGSQAEAGWRYGPGYYGGYPYYHHHGYGPVGYYRYPPVRYVYRTSPWRPAYYGYGGYGWTRPVAAEYGWNRGNCVVVSRPYWSNWGYRYVRERVCY